MILGLGWLSSVEFLMILGLGWRSSVIFLIITALSCLLRCLKSIILPMLFAFDALWGIGRLPRALAWGCIGLVPMWRRVIGHLGDV
jgi:hypothetical protein